MKTDSLLYYYHNLENLKRSRMDLMRDINSFFSPDDYTYTGDTKIGFSSVEQGELLDTTGSDLLREFVSYTLGLFFDAERRWFTMSMEGYEEDSDVKQILEKQSDVLFKCIGRTNYYSEAAMHDWDCLVHGHAVMAIDPDDESFAVCRTKNPLNVFLDQDRRGRVKTVMWTEQYSHMDIIREFPDFKIKLADVGLNEEQIEQHFGEVYRDIEIITAYMEVDENLMTPEQMEKFKGYKWVRRFLLDLSGLKVPEGVRSVEFDKFDGFKEEVIFPVRDVVTREHAYGDGKGKIVLPKARILNALAADMLRLSKLKANPPLMMTADLAREMGLINRRSSTRHGFVEKQPIRPGSVYIFDVEKLEETRGIGPVQILNVDGKLEEIRVIYESVREQTAELLPIAGQVYKVARQSISEIQQRTEQQAKRLGPIRANYVREGLSKHLKRFYSIAKKAGKFRDLPLPEDRRGNIKFVFDAFLLQTKRVSDSLRLSQSLNIVSQAMLAKPGMVDWLNGDKIMNGVFEANGVLKYLNSQEAVAQIRQNAQAEAQRQAQNQQSQIDASSISAGAKAAEVFREIQGGG